MLGALLTAAPQPVYTSVHPRAGISSGLHSRETTPASGVRRSSLLKAGHTESLWLVSPCLYASTFPHSNNLQRCCPALSHSILPAQGSLERQGLFVCTAQLCPGGIEEPSAGRSCWQH